MKKVRELVFIIVVLVLGNFQYISYASAEEITNSTQTYSYSNDSVEVIEPNIQTNDSDSKSIINSDFVIAMIGLGGVFITAMFGIFKNSKNIQSKNIIEERANWRHDLRKILSEGITVGQYKKIRPLLNSYGFLKDSCSHCRSFTEIKNETDNFYMYDGHIWDAMKNNDNEMIERYLILLLKYEWERSKVESTKYFLKNHYLKIEKNRYLYELKNCNNNPKITPIRATLPPPCRRRNHRRKHRK